MSKKYKTAVFIGRFQPIHKAHIETIKDGLAIAEQIIISVGTAKRARTIKNPWSTRERIELIKSAISEYYGEDFKEVKDRLLFTEVRDHKYNNTKWATEVYSKAIQAGASHDKNTILLGCFKDDSSFYLNMFPQWDFKETKRLYKKDERNIKKLINATDIRDEIFLKNEIKNNLNQISTSVIEYINSWKDSSNFKRLKEEYDFLKAYKSKWEDAPFPPTFITTDTVVVKSGHILLVKRKFDPGKGLWALPGGFLSQKEKIKDSAVRELKEETRIRVDKPVLRRSIVDSEVFDHPERSDRGRTITHAFLLDLDEGPLPYVKGGDDASGAHWVPLADLQAIEDELYEDHMDIILRMTSRF